MNRTLFFGGSFTFALALIVLSARTAQSGQATSGAFVQLQPSTPGTPQSGAFNISGVAIAGLYKGSGAGLTNLAGPAITSGLIADARLGPNVPLANRLNTFAAVQRFASNLLMTSQNSTVLFPAVAAGPQQPMMTMFASGTANTDRMVLALAPTLQNWGLQYQDSTDVFNFLSAGTPVMSIDLANSKVGIGTSTPSANLQVVSTGAATALHAVNSGTGSAGAFSSSGSASPAATFSSGGTGAAATFSISNAASSSPTATFGTAGTGAAATFDVANSTSSAAAATFGSAGTGPAASFGITNSASTSPTANFVTSGLGSAGTFSISNAASSATVGTFATNGTGAAGAFSLTNPSSAATALTVSSAGTGVGLSLGLTNASSSARGIDVSHAGSGTGIYADSTNGYAIWGTAHNASAAAIRGDNASGEVIVANGTSGGAGIGALVGRQDGSFGYGVRGFVTSDSSIGVYGQTGLNSSQDGTGVKGQEMNVVGSGIGVNGSATGANQYGLFSNGRTGATGTKSFVIDHPEDPLHKLLIHYTTEGDQPLNAYSGNVTTDGNGRAWVLLPSYVEEINKDFRYQLTVIGDFAQAIIGEEIKSNKFLIRTDKPNIKVSWRVEGVRNDRFVQRRGAPVEVDKPARWNGKYLIPDLYDAPPTMGVDYAPLPPSPSNRGLAGVAKSRGR